MGTETEVVVEDNKTIRFILTIFGAIITIIILFFLLVYRGEEQKVNVPLPLLNHSVKSLIDAGYLIPACHQYNITASKNAPTNLALSCLRNCYVVNDSIDINTLKL